MFGKSKKSNLIKWNENQQKKAFRSTDKIVFTDIIKPLIHTVTFYGTDKKNTILYELINDNAFFEIACYYFVRTDFYLFHKHPEHRTKIQLLFSPFLEIFSYVLNKPVSQVRELLHDRISIFASLFKESDSGIDNLIQFVYFAENLKDNVLIGSEYPSTIDVKDVFYDLKVKQYFDNYEKNSMKAYQETVDKIIELTT